MNNWLLYRSPSEDEAQRICDLLQPIYDKAHFNTKPGHWGSLSFYEVRIVFADKITAEKFIEMGILIGRNIKQ